MGSDEAGADAFSSGAPAASGAGAQTPAPGSIKTVTDGGSGSEFAAAAGCTGLPH